MNFEYTHTEGGPTDPHEVAVIKAGYKWVRTNTVVATRPGEFKPDLPIDRLNQHKHSGPNTHLIVEGDISFEMERDPYLEAKFKHRKRPPVTVGGALDAADPDARKEFPALAGHRYKATSTSGCSFVEGHLLLSPVTAERFMDRGTLRAIPPFSLDDDAGETVWPHQEEIQDLLRTAKWYPCGVSGLENDLKPQMMWDDDPVDADADEQYTILRSGRRVPKLQPKGEEGNAADGAKTPKRGGRGTDALHKASATTAQAKKMLAAWFKNEWKDYSENSHRNPPYIQYADLYRYDDEEKVEKPMKSDKIHSVDRKKSDASRKTRKFPQKGSQTTADELDFIYLDAI
ncbi:uncharacterized protein PG998_011446 [Apiospora kogelbergensis]|uniref:uncharacterized protein n=1 Tax=Apiospora kogelbergensis TaxID=1337665 RepID=UPI003131C847